MKFSLDTLIIAVDFDGTIVEDAYPKVGKPMIFAFETLKKLQEDGHRLILWTYRCGDRLDEAVEFCKDNGIIFYAVNNSFSEEKYDNSISRKINADIFIDDRNIGGFPGWGVVYQELTNSTPPIPQKKKGFFDLFK
ncbi:BT0820 family HAD-type phosphatase [uncultured Algibacter sp.]|uniref:BT0820 family HAD-type phosphatase n=1 Tax=uncultured Algibacter sp. TaxID=298659 RepID=UPI00261B042F|nr:hydrolase [uncultured Algibacter sp.]